MYWEVKNQTGMRSYGTISKAWDAELFAEVEEKKGVEGRRVCLFITSEDA